MMTKDQMQQNEEVSKAAEANIMKHNWSDEPITAQEQQVIGLAVDYVLARIRDGSLFVIEDDIPLVNNNAEIIQQVENTRKVKSNSKYRIFRRSFSKS